MWTCATCAQPNDTGAAACVACGAPHPAAVPVAPTVAVLPAPPPPPTSAPAPGQGPPPPVDDGSRRSRTGRWVAAVVLVVLLVGGGVAAALVLGGQGDESGEERTAEPDHDGAADPPTTTAPDAEPPDEDEDLTTTRPAPTVAVPTTPAPTTAPASGGGLTPSSQGWITVLLSMPDQASATSWRDANAPGATVLATDSYASLTPAYWIVAYGPHADADEAIGVCTSLGLTSRQDCFAAPLSSDPADRDLRVYPD